MISYGINQVEVSGGDSWMREVDIRKCMQGIKDLGASDIRMACVWSFIESAKGKFNWGPLDRGVNLAQEYGLTPTLIIQFPAPSWGGGAGNYGKFATAVAARYGSAGTNQVKNYEIMNEMNMILNLSPPTAAQYAPFLKSAYLGIKSVHPTGSNVITGGVMACVSGFFNVDAAAFCKGLYKQGCKGYFDTMGWHWYSNTSGFDWEAPSTDQLFYREMLDVRDRMVAEGDSAKPIWVTEFGVPFPTLTAQKCRDWMEIQVNALSALPWVGKWFIYNYRNTGKDLSNANNQFGLVDFAYNKKQPLFDYVASISPSGVTARFGGEGTVSAAARIRRGAAFSGAGSFSAIVRPARMANFTGSGQLEVDVYGRPGADFSGSGDLSATVVPRGLAAAAFSASGELSAVAERNSFRDANFGGVGALSCTVRQQRFFSHSFSGTTKPTTFTDFGTWSYYVQFNTAWNGNAAFEGRWTSGAIYNTDHYSPNHYVEVILGNGGNAYDRSVMAIVRSDPSGQDWVGVTMRAGGSTSSQIITSIGGNKVVRATNSTSAGNNDILGLSADGNLYTVYKNGDPTGLTWTDFGGDFPGVTNTRTGFGFQHARSNGALYGTPGIRSWLAMDLRSSVLNLGSYSGGGSLSATTAVKVAAALGGGGALTAKAEVAGGPRLTNYNAAGVFSAIVSTQYPRSAAFTGSGIITSAAVQAVAVPVTGEGSLSADVRGLVPVARVATGTVQTATGTGGTRSIVIPITVPSGVANGVMVVGAKVSHDGWLGYLDYTTFDAASDVDGAFLRPSVANNGTTGQLQGGVATFTLLNPTPGAHNITVTFKPGSYNAVNVTGNAAVYANVASGVYGAASVRANSTGNINITSFSTNDMTVATGVFAGTPAGYNQTAISIAGASVTGTGDWMVFGEAQGNGSVVNHTTTNSTYYGFTGVTLRA